MFGLSFPELVVLLLVAVVVLGPKELPRYLRKAGQLAGQLRRMAYDMRVKSGIDEIMRQEGIGADIAEIRRLASFARTELGSIITSVQATANSASLVDKATRPATAGAPPAVNGTAPVSAPSSATPDTAATPYAPTFLGATTAAGLAAVAAVPRTDGLAYSPGLVRVDRGREYPSGGPDAYGALPEGSGVYEGQLADSPLAADPLYAGEAASPEAQP